MATIISINPATGEKVGETTAWTQKEVNTAVINARKAYIEWKEIPISERVQYLVKLADILEKRKEEFAKLITQEMGKPLHESMEEIESEIPFIRWYAANAQRIYEEKIIHEDKTTVYKTVYEPYGVCVSIAPWNFPVTMASTGICAQLVAGNTVIFKPSEYTTLSQKLFVDALNSTGLPKDVLQCTIGAGDVGKMLVENNIDLVWFTGSTAVGQELYKKSAEKFIPCLLELGGSSPAIVFADCDFEKTVETVYQARFYNCGQICNALKRLFVEKPIFDTFVSTLIQRVKKSKLGPLVSAKQLTALESQIADATQKGATILTGGKKLPGKGNFFEPTVLTNISKDMKVFTEEVFGPVIPIIPFESEEQAVRMANDTVYGLSALIFTKDADKANRIAGQLQAGGISINMDLAYRPFGPMGGYKLSGIGREYGDEGMKDLAQLKYICVAKE